MIDIGDIRKLTVGSFFSTLKGLVDCALDGEATPPALGTNSKFLASSTHWFGRWFA